MNLIQGQDWQSSVSPTVAGGSSKCEGPLQRPPPLDPAPAASLGTHCGPSSICLRAHVAPEPGSRLLPQPAGSDEQHRATSHPPGLPLLP